MNHSLIDFVRYQSKIRLNDKLAGVLRKLFVKYLSAKRKLITKAYFQSCHGRELNFLIVLKEDTEENRDAIFELLEQYEDTPLFEIHPVNFYFASFDLVAEYSDLEEIDFEDEWPLESGKT